MKRISIVLSLSLLMAWPALAVDSIEFSTAPGAAFSWELTNVGGTWQLSFPSTATEVDSSQPVDPILEGDFVSLPTMTLTNLTSPVAGIVTGTLTPVGDMTIQANASDGSVPAGTTVLAGSLTTGVFLTDGMSYTAYDMGSGELTITSFVSDYGTAIPKIAADESAGSLIDLAFSGNATIDLRALLMGTNTTATVNGNLSGLIVAAEAVPPVVIPAPGSLLLAALGTIVAGWLRQRKLFV